MKKAQIVKCVECPGGEFTVGKEYEVLAGNGDKDTVVGGTVWRNGMILKTDEGIDAYCVFPEGYFGKWEVVS